MTHIRVEVTIGNASLRYRVLLLILVGILTVLPAFSQNKSKGTATGPNVFVYQKIDTTELTLEVYNPPNLDPKKSYPVIIFFFGGGWRTGSTEQFKPHAQYFASRGLVSVVADYRVKERQGTTPIESLKDAKSAIRFIRKNANQLHIDTAKVIAAGGSAGGQLAAATAWKNEFNNTTDDLRVNSRPSALVLFNPAIDNGPGGAGYELFGENYKNASPLHNINKGLPPAIFFLGTRDAIVPVETAQYYKKAYEHAGNRLDLHLYEGQTHGFFNYKRSIEYYEKTVKETDVFLKSLGYVSGEPTISAENVRTSK